MLKLRKKSDNTIAGGHIDSIENLLGKAKEDGNNPNLVYWRQRKALNVYVIEIWTASPIDNPNAKHLYDIEGVKRKNLKRMPKLIGGRPSRLPGRPGRPNPGPNPGPA